MKHAKRSLLRAFAELSCTMAVHFLRDLDFTNVYMTTILFCWLQVYFTVHVHKSAYPNVKAISCIDPVLSSDTVKFAQLNRA